MSEKEFPEGISVRQPNERAPDFVIANISIKRETLIAWLSARGGEWVNLDVLKSKKGIWYCAVNNWKPRNENTAPGPGGGTNAGVR